MILNFKITSYCEINQKHYDLEIHTFEWSVEIFEDKTFI